MVEEHICLQLVVVFFLSDLSRPFERTSAPSSLVHTPQGDSQGTSMQTRTFTVSLELDISPLLQRLVSDSERVIDMPPCSLERLGIVPVRSLGKGKFGSLRALHFSLMSPWQRQHRQSTGHSSTSPGSSPQPVVVKGMRTGCPAADTSLKQGEWVWHDYGGCGIIMLGVIFLWWCDILVSCVAFLRCDMIELA